MKLLPGLVLPLAAALASALPASAANLMLNFQSTSTNAAAAGAVAAPYLTLSPGHSTGSIGTGETSWNNFASTAASTSLVWSDGTAATELGITFGSESSASSGVISYTTTNINLSALYGSGGGNSANLYYLSNPSSIYGSGNNSSNTAVGRAGWLGGAVNTAIGMRVDGLAAGDYRIYVMARNTNANGAGTPVGVFASTGALSNSFTFSSLTAVQQSNPVYASTNTTAYNTFINGENYVTLSVTVGEDQSLFIASDGASAGETRGFFNAVQIVAVPEPSSLLMGMFGLLLVRRRR